MTIDQKFPEHLIMHISHNDHKSAYQSVEQEIEDRGFTFRDEEQKQRCIEADELWEMQWYPRTPIGFHLIAAPTWVELMEFAQVFDGD